MQLSEEQKINLIELREVPSNVIIDANQEVNREMLDVTLIEEDHIDYGEFLQKLKDSANHELYVRIKKFVDSIQRLVPEKTPELGL